MRLDKERVLCDDDGLVKPFILTSKFYELLNDNLMNNFRLIAGHSAVHKIYLGHNRIAIFYS